MGLSSNLIATMSSLIVASLPLFCTSYTKMEKATLLAGFAFDTVLSFDGLFLFLVSNIALTLFGTSLFTVSLGSTLVLVAVAIHKMQEAHSAFMALAPGSIPSSAAGFWKAIQIARSGPVVRGIGYLQPLGLRSGSTPYTAGTAPQQQTNQQSPEDVQQYFSDRLSLFAMLQSDDSSTISSVSDVTASTPASSCDCTSHPDLRMFGCGICRPLGSNSGAHVILHPSDFEQVTETGWGEVHPLANSGCAFSRSRRNPCLPGTLTLVYAPREYSEVCTVMRIIEAGSKYLASLEGKST